PSAYPDAAAGLAGACAAGAGVRRIADAGRGPRRPLRLPPDARRLAHLGSQQRRARRLHRGFELPGPDGGAFPRRRAGRRPGPPAARLADALAAAAQRTGRVVLVAAPGYMEDQQVVAYVAALLRRRGRFPCLTDPRQVQWEDGAAHIPGAGAADVLYRFYQA